MKLRNIPFLWITQAKRAGWNKSLDDKLQFDVHIVVVDDIWKLHELDVPKIEFRIFRKFFVTFWIFFHTTFKNNPIELLKQKNVQNR